MEQADQPLIRDTKALIAQARETCRQSQKLIAEAHELIEHLAVNRPGRLTVPRRGFQPRRPR